eukprot:g70971.t1
MGCFCLCGVDVLCRYIICLTIVWCGVFVICAIIPIIPSMLPLNIIAIIAFHHMGLCLCVSARCVSLIIINIPVLTLMGLCLFVSGCVCFVNIDIPFLTQGS